MDVTPLVKQGAQIIQSYKGGRFKVSGKTYDTPVMVMPHITEEWHAPDDIVQISLEHLSVVVAHAAELDVVLLGTGARQVFFPPVLKNTLAEKGVMVEAMDTGAACRTYNVLMAEGRRVAALLVPY